MRKLALQHFMGFDLDQGASQQPVMLSALQQQFFTQARKNSR
jgi:hypothetical protein